MTPEQAKVVNDVLDAAETLYAIVPSEVGPGMRGAMLAWIAAGCPLLSARARAILDVVQVVMARCDACDREWHITRGLEVRTTCGDCPQGRLRHAYLGTGEAKPATDDAPCGKDEEEVEEDLELPA